MSTKNIVLSGLFLALCIVLPFLTGQIPEIGSMLLPMHLPVLLCGFICGWPFGLVVGAVAPVLRSAIFTMPPMFPTAVAMTFELAAYGLVSGLLYKLLPKKNAYIFVALIAAMLAGRIVWGGVSYILYGIGGTAFTWEIFMSGAILKALPGIAVQIVLIPLLVIALRKAKLIEYKGSNNTETDTINA
ncbi:MAG: ECF transporter S component [Burkholderiales bacterium]